MLTVTTQTVADTVILHCRGRLVRGEESALLCAAVRHHGRDVVLDLAQVTAIDAAGIGALVSLQAAGIYLKLMGPTEMVRDVLRLTGLESLFEICQADLIQKIVHRHSAPEPDAMTRAAALVSSVV